MNFEKLDLIKQSVKYNYFRKTFAILLLFYNIIKFIAARIRLPEYNGRIQTTVNKL